MSPNRTMWIEDQTTTSVQSDLCLHFSQRKREGLDDQLSYIENTYIVLPYIKNI